jgi:hypothetical protein
MRKYSGTNEPQKISKFAPSKTGVYGTIFSHSVILALCKIAHFLGRESYRIKTGLWVWQRTCTYAPRIKFFDPETAMKEIRFAYSVMLAVVALSAVLFSAGQAALRQSADSSRNPATQPRPVQLDSNQNAGSAAPETMFSGKIVKSGAKLVLTDPDNKTTYQLDDQQKARDVLNQRVRITGALDPSTGTIRVSVINPA